MKKNMCVLVLAAAAVVLVAGCGFFPAVEGSGFPRTESYDLPGFTKITAESTFKVQVVPDTAYSVSVTSDDNIVSYLVVERNGDTLTLGLKPGYNYRQVILAAEVHMPLLLAVSLSGASEARILSGFTGGQPLNISVSGASTLESASLTCSALLAEVSGASTLTIQGVGTGVFTANVSGASTLTATGSAGNETLAVSGASKADLRGLSATQASATISGASKAYVNVGGGRITLSASGASTLYHTGNPTFVINELSGASSILHL